MQITSGQQYNVGEKPTVILYTRKTLKTRQCCNTPSHMVVVIYILKVVNTILYKVTTWYLNGFPTGSNLGSTV